MIKNYSLSLVCALSFAVFTILCEFDVPPAHELQRDLRATCQERFHLIKKADEQGCLQKIGECHNQIRYHEAKSGIADAHREQAKIINILALTQHEPTRCALLDHFDHYDQKRFENCTTAKCHIMRLYAQVGHLTDRLACSLQPYKQELLKLNEKIYRLRAELKRTYGIEDEILTLHPNMLFL